MKVYIAGKVSGLPQDEVIAKFDRAETKIKDMGLTPVNPLKIVGNWNTPWETAMRKCIATLTECDAVYFMPDYKQSQGAMREYEVATFLKIKKVFHIDSLYNHIRPYSRLEMEAENLGWALDSHINHGETFISRYSFKGLVLEFTYIGKTFTRLNLSGSLISCPITTLDKLEKLTSIINDNN